jgi:IclR family acetate operon transcriptional repressor
MKPYPGTQAALRTVRLLKAFPPGRETLRLSELCRRVGLNKTTTYRLLTALESEGLVERGPGGEAYRLGPELLVLGARAFGASDLREAARPELLALARTTRERASLEVLVGADVLVLDEVMGGYLVGAMPSVGTRWPAYATSTGRALLAHLPREDREAFLRGPLPAITARTITDVALLKRELARVEDQGYAVSAEELENGFVAVGAPVQGPEGGAVAALCVGGPRVRLGSGRVREIARRLRRSAVRVSDRLGPRSTLPRERAKR